MKFNLISPNKITLFQHTGFNSPVTEMAIILIGHKKGVYHSFGSGVIIGCNVALTACHVIRQFFDFFDDVKLDQSIKLSDAGFSLQAIHFLEKGSVAQIWHITKISFIENLTDLAFLFLVPVFDHQENYKWMLPKIQLLPPPVGSIISGFGYHSTKIISNSNGPEITTNPYTSSGQVEQIHHSERDSALLSFPCYRTNARFDGAMSGGPIFNSEGFLCGIICNNMEPFAENKEHSSHITTLWPSTLIPLTFNRPNHPADIEYPAVELMRDGFIKAVDLDKIEFSTDSNKKLTITGLNFITTQRETL